MSIVSDASTPSNGGKQELMHYVHWVSSHLPPLDTADASDTIDTGVKLGLILFQQNLLGALYGPVSKIMSFQMTAIVCLCN